MKEMQIRVHGSQIRFIHNDDLAGFMDEGEMEIKRASHVEPCQTGGWLADLTPTGGPVLGPFLRRDKALEAEVEWLNKNNIPLPA